MIKTTQFLLLGLALLVVIACGGGLSDTDAQATTGAATAEALTANPPTHTPRPTATPTATPVHAPTPSNTSTITPMPTQTSAPSPTPDLALTATAETYDELTAPKRDGLYVVGEEILPGKWHSTGTGSDCYWARLDEDQDTIDNHSGDAGGTVTVQATDYEVEFRDCGAWEYVEGAERLLLENAAEPKYDGFYTVGVEIAIGTWRSTSTGGNCYWARLDGNQGILDNHFGKAGGTVSIQATDYEIEFSGCGTWEYQGP